MAVGLTPKMRTGFLGRASGAGRPFPAPTASRAVRISLRIDIAAGPLVFTITPRADFITAPGALPSTPDSQIFQDLRVRLFGREDGVALVAVLGDDLARARLVVVVVAAEAPREILVPDVLGVGPPRDPHVVVDVTRVNRLGLLDRGVEERLFLLDEIRVGLLVVVG